MEQTGGGGSDPAPPPLEDWNRDILSTGLELNLETLTGKATIVLAASDSKGASFEVGDLEITSVKEGDQTLQFSTTTEKQLDVGVPSNGSDSTLVIEYSFAGHPNFDGWWPEQGVSFLWPYFCGNLFPCKSTPQDGVKFELAVTGVPDGATAVYPATIPGDAPSYQPAIAVGAYAKLDTLPVTTNGTIVSVWYRTDLPNQEQDAIAGSAHLSQVIDFFEQTYGDYTFGPEVGTVSVDWPGGDYGGMEHHPYWHVDSGTLKDEHVNAHEAAHGWFGDGVRIACWEDFVLSEGTAEYISARALELEGVDVWPEFCEYIDSICTGEGNTVALPDTCNEIDIFNHPIWSLVPYTKGAFFYREVANLITPELLDDALSAFYQDHVGTATNMQTLIDAIKDKAPEHADEIDALATGWLRTEACPASYQTMCAL